MFYGGCLDNLIKLVYDIDFFCYNCYRWNGFFGGLQFIGFLIGKLDCQIRMQVKMVFMYLVFVQCDLYFMFCEIWL